MIGMTHGWIFRTLAFVDRGGVGGHVQLTKPVGDGSTVEVGDELAIGGIDTIDVANVAVLPYGPVRPWDRAPKSLISLALPRGLEALFSP
jgi:hypothetical protein